MIQRQKGIAERSAAGNSPATSKRMPVKKTSALNNESKTQPPNQETKKRVFRSSTIDRLANARTTPKVESAQSKPAQSKKVPLRAKGLAQKTAGADKKSSPNTVKANVPQNKEGKVAAPQESKEVPATSKTDEFKDVKDLHSISSVEKSEGNSISQKDALDDKGKNGDSSHFNSSAPLDHFKGNDVGLSVVTPILSENIKNFSEHDQYK